MLIDDEDAAAELALHPPKPTAGLDANGLIKHSTTAMALDYPAIFADRPWTRPGYAPATGPVYDEVRRDVAKDTFGCVDLDDMLAEPEVKRKWALEGILGAGSSMLLGGDPKIGKSTLARVWAVATAAGVSFLGRSTQAGPVLWLAADAEGRETFKRHGRALRPYYQIQHAVKWAGYADLPEVQQRVAWLKAAIEMHGYALVIIDNIVNFFELGENDTKYGLIAKATTPLLATMQTTGCSLVMLTHTNNARKIFGGTGWTRVADINVLYEVGRGGVRYISTVLGGRDDTGFDPIPIAYDRNNGMVNVGNNPREEAIRECEQALLDRPSGTKEEQVRGCGFDMPLARQAHGNLVKAGLLVMTKVGKREIYSDPESRPPSLSVVQEERSSSNVLSLSIETDLNEAQRTFNDVPPEEQRTSNDVPPEEPAEIHYCQSCGTDIDQAGYCNECPHD